MARKLPRKDVVIVGLGWTGSILAHELTDAGLDVVAIERGPGAIRRQTSTSPMRPMSCATPCARTCSCSRLRKR